MEIEREMYSGWNSGQIELGSTMLAFAPQSTYPSTWELILTTPHNANTKTNAENKRTFFLPILYPSTWELYNSITSTKTNVYANFKCTIHCTVSDRSENLLLITAWWDPIGDPNTDVVNMLLNFRKIKTPFLFFVQWMPELICYWRLPLYSQHRSIRKARGCANKQFFAQINSLLLLAQRDHLDNAIVQWQVYFEQDAIPGHYCCEIWWKWRRRALWTFGRGGAGLALAGLSSSKSNVLGTGLRSISWRWWWVTPSW